MDPTSNSDQELSVIPNISNKAAYEANMVEIDKLTKTRRYFHIVAWGKWLGFSPQAVQRSVEQADAENAPEDAIQKFDHKWHRVGDIANETNREQVNALAASSSDADKGN